MVYNREEAYSNPDEIAAFLPDRPIPEPVKTTTEPEAEDGLQVEEERIEEEVIEGATAPKKRGRPKKDVQ